MRDAIIKRNNIRIFGNPYAQKTILFAHGFGFDQNAWRAITPEFEQDYRIILIDHSGSGKSDRTQYDFQKYNSLHGYGQDVIEIAEALELEHIIFIGHSVGSMIGVITSMDKSNLIDHLIMIGPSPRYINEPGYVGGFEQIEVETLLHMMEKNYQEWAKYLAPLAMKNPDRPELADQFESTLIANDEQIARQFAEVTFLSDMRDLLPQINVPVLILQSGDDAIVPMDIGPYMQNAIPNCQLIQMNATGHNPHISHPEETVRHIRNYLQSI